MRSSTFPGLVLLAWTCAVSLPASAAEETTAAGSFRLRVEWGGGAARTWTGLLEIDEGRFGEVVPLGVDADLPGSMWSEGGAVWIQRRAARVYDGIDVVVRTRPEATVRVTLESVEPTPLRTSFDVPLLSLVDGSRTESIGRAGDRVIVRRAPGDVLALRTDRSHLVFAPGEAFDAGIAINVWSERALETRGRFAWRLTPARSETTLARGAESLTIRTNAAEPDVQPVRVAMPGTEGAYDLHVEVESRSVRHRTRIPVVVASRTPNDEPVPNDSTTGTGPGDAIDSRLVDEFQPNESSGRRLVKRSRLNFLRRPLADLARQLPFGPDESPEVQPENPWAAYTLQIDDVDTLHEVVLTLDATTPRTVGASLLQPNAAGQLVPLGLDTGLVILAGDGEPDDAGRHRVRHVVPFWPRTKRPVLLLHTMGSAAAVDVERVDVFAIEGAPQRTLPPVDRRSHRRLVGPYLHRPLLPEAFGAGEAFDVDTRRSLDDWQTFETASRRLAEQLHRQGANAAMLAVMADGSTIFPSRHLQPTSRYDTGLHFTDGRDPMRKDVVELLLRRFDHEQLALVPVLRFSTALPAVERARSRQASSGLELINVDGRAYRDVHPAGRGGGTDYNPLNPRVQEAVLEVVREFADRYADHPSLAAVAIEIDPAGCLQFPGSDWGYDEETVTRFAAETSVVLPNRNAEDGPAARRRALRGRLRDRWVEWRAGQLTDFHARLARVITEADPALRCVFVVPGDSAGVESVDTAALARLDRTLVLERAHPLCEAPPLDGRRGFVGYDEPVDVRIAGFDELSPWQPAFTWLAAHVSSVGARERIGCVRALRNDDVMVFHGGWMPRVGQEEWSRSVRAAIASLPDTKLVDVARTPQPLVVRTGRDRDGRSWVVVVNDFPHPAEARITLGGTVRQDERYRELKLGPRDFALFSIEPGVRVAGVTAAVPARAREELRGRLRDLDSAIVRLRERTPARRGELVNPGFELAGATEESLPGWSVRNALHWNVDEGNARSGRAALMLAPQPMSVASIGSDLALDHERHVLVSTWLKSDTDDADARLVFEMSVDGRPRRRFAPVRVDRTWRRYEFRIDDVPPELTSAHVRFEVRGPSRVWIDDVDVRMAHVTRTELRQLETTSAAAGLALEQGRYADALRLLEGSCRQFVDAPTVTTPETESAVSPASAADEDATPLTPTPEPAPRRSWPWRLLR